MSTHLLNDADDIDYPPPYKETTAADLEVMAAAAESVYLIQKPTDSSLQIAASIQCQRNI